VDKHGGQSYGMHNGFTRASEVFDISRATLKKWHNDEKDSKPVEIRGANVAHYQSRMEKINAYAYLKKLH
jgi:hypothetical protein